MRGPPLGLLWTALLNASLLLGGYLAARGALRQPAGFPRVLGATVLAWAWATVGLQGLGSLGLLGRGPLLGWSVAGMVLAVAVGCRGGGSAEGKRAAEGWDWPATLAVGLVLWACLGFGLTSLLRPLKVVSDGPIYHLYFAVRWWKAGRLFLVAAPFGENAATYFPAGGDLWFAWLLTGWGGDRLARVGQAPFLLLGASAAYGMARRLGAGASASAIAAALFVAPAPMLLFAFEPNVDAIFAAGYLVAAYFFLRFALGDDGPAALALGALAAGLAWGTKPTGTVFIPPLLALAAAAALARPGSRRAKLGRLAILAAGPVLVAGFWFARDAWLTGNPLYPLQVQALGKVWLAGWYGPEVMRRSPYYIDPRNGRDLVDLVVAVVDPRLVPLWASALLGFWALGRPRASTDRLVWLMAVLAVANVALYWLLIPYRTQQRFFLHALGLAAVPVARLLDRSAALRWLAPALLGLHLLTPVPWPWPSQESLIPWDLDPRIPNAMPALVTPGSWPAGLGALLLAWVWNRARSTPTAARRLLAAAVGAGVVGGLGVLFYPWDAGAFRRFYPEFPQFLPGWYALERASGPDGRRVAYAGTNIPYYLFGSGLRNSVRYVNVDAHRGWLLHDYHRAAAARGRANWPHPRPGWDRARPDYDAWLANLRAARIELLVVTRADPNEGPHNIADALGFPIERTWAERHPDAFAPLYGVAERDPFFRLYRVLPPRGEPPGGARAIRAGRSPG